MSNNACIMQLLNLMMKKISDTPWPYFLDRGDKVYFGRFTNEYCTNYDDNEVSC